VNDMGRDEVRIYRRTNSTNFDIES